MRTPEEVIGASALAALVAEGYVVAEPCDLWPTPRFVTREQRDIEAAKMLMKMADTSYVYSAQKEKRDE